MDLFNFQDQTISTQTFIDKLSPYIQQGDTLYVEVDTMVFGRLATTISSKQQFLQAFLTIFEKLVGESGHVILPAFSYSWGNNKPTKLFDVNNTSSQVGIFPEYVRQTQNCLRSDDPMFSYLVLGAHANDYICQTNSSFNDRSIWQKLYQDNAKLMSFGLKQYDPTIVHFAEQKFNNEIKPIGYRSEVPFKGTLIDQKGNQSEQTRYAFMRSLEATIDFSEKNMVKDLKLNQQLVDITVGGGHIYIADAQDVVNTCIKGMEKNIYYLTNYNVDE